MTKGFAVIKAELVHDRLRHCFVALLLACPLLLNYKIALIGIYQHYWVMLAISIVMIMMILLHSFSNKLSSAMPM